MRKFCVVGNPIKHSLSPTLHNYLIEALSLDASYNLALLPKDISKQDFKSFILDSKLDGLNVTLPFKELAYLASDILSPLARSFKSVNTIVVKDSKLYGYNTDASGFYECIKNLDAKKILILGAGGSARAIGMHLLSNKLDVVVANKSSSNLLFFKQNGFKTLLYEELKENQESDLVESNLVEFDLIINATSSSVQEVLPCSLDLLESLFKKQSLKGVFDLFYTNTTKGTIFTSLAKKLGVKNTYDGMDMLIYQAAFASLYFYNLKQDCLENVIKLMQDSLK